MTRPIAPEELLSKYIPKLPDEIINPPRTPKTPAQVLQEFQASWTNRTLLSLPQPQLRFAPLDPATVRSLLSNARTQTTKPTTGNPRCIALIQSGKKKTEQIFYSKGEENGFCTEKVALPNGKGIVPVSAKKIGYLDLSVLIGAYYLQGIDTPANPIRISPPPGEQFRIHSYEYSEFQQQILPQAATQTFVTN